MDVYQRLREKLDDLPGGFPATESGVELRILRRLFTPEEAELTIQMSILPESARVIARRVKGDPEAVAARLRDMSHKGLLMRLAPSKPGGAYRYVPVQFVIGIWEFQVKDLSEELIRDMEEYQPYLEEVAWRVPQLRTIPVGRSVADTTTVLPHEEIRALAAQHTKFAVAPCICRRAGDMMGQTCDRPEETCLVFDMAADYYLENNLAREIDREEMLAVIDMAEKKGLVLQPGNSKNIANICCCCSCCCAVLKGIKRRPSPAEAAAAPFYAVLDQSLCQGCGVCETRCQMEALRLDDDVARLDGNRCIGCGLCVTTCPAGALSLARKAPADQPETPRDMIWLSIKMARERGVWGWGRILGDAARSVGLRLAVWR